MLDLRGRLRTEVIAGPIRPAGEGLVLVGADGSQSSLENILQPYVGIRVRIRVELLGAEIPEPEHRGPRTVREIGMRTSYDGKD